MIPSYLGRLRSRGLQFKASLGKYFKISPISKITREKWTGDVGQAVE
jgi:hypothetical protein